MTDDIFAKSAYSKNSGWKKQGIAPRRASFFDIIGKISDALAKVDLTITDLYEMLDDSGITLVDILEVYNYLTSDSHASAAPVNMMDDNVETPVNTMDDNMETPVNTMADKVEAPIYLMRKYEQTLANWLLLGGIDVNYSQWGW